jgi:hypothetical protein
MTSLNFCIFVIISPLKKTYPFIWTNLNLLYPKINCTKYNWNWLTVSGEKHFLRFSVFFSPFCCYLPLVKGYPLHLNKLESPRHPPHPPVLFVSSVVKIGQLVLEKKLKMWKVKRQMDDGQQAIRKAHSSFQLSWAKNRKKCILLYLLCNEQNFCLNAWESTVVIC